MGPVKVPLCVFVNVRLSILEHFVPLAGRDLKSDFKSDANAKWYLSRRLGRRDAVIQPQRLASVAQTALLPSTACTIQMARNRGLHFPQAHGCPRTSSGSKGTIGFEMMAIGR